MLIDDNVREKVREAAFEHLFHVMGNKSLFMEPYNISTVQYMNEKNHINLLKFKELLLKKLISFDRGGIYLNIGTGCGHLEYVNMLMGSKIHISNVEWENQYECCKKVREIFDVNVNYVCNDVLKDDFDIYGCKTHYDYLILERFFPIYKSLKPERIEYVLKQLAPYAKQSLIVESDSNWSKEQKEYIEKISIRKLKITSKWYCNVVSLGNYK